MQNIAKFDSKIDEIFEKEIKIFFQNIPYASHLTDKNVDLDENYYIRHRIETIKRIKMTSRTDAIALAEMINENYDLSRKWAKYTLQEMNHDLMFMKDLKTHGYTQSQVDDVELFESTKNLGAYLEDSISKYGPIAAVAYSLFVEWNSDRYSKKAVEKAQEKYSERHISGSKAHVHFDEDHDHYQLIMSIAYHLIRDDDHEMQFFQITKDISSLFRSYFMELYQDTINKKTI